MTIKKRLDFFSRFPGIRYLSISGKTGKYLNVLALLRAARGRETEHGPVRAAEMGGIREPCIMRGFGQRLFAQSRHLHRGE